MLVVSHYKQFSFFSRSFLDRTGGINNSGYGGFDDRPITPMRATFSQVADKYGEAFDSPSYNDRSPTRERTSLKNTRTMSASQRTTTMNSMSRTIDPRSAANYQEQRPRKNHSPSRTLGSATRQRNSLNTSNDDYNVTLKDNPRQDAFGPLAKDIKINTLRT